MSDITLLQWIGLGLGIGIAYAAIRAVFKRKD
ncbi:hypothetical protein J2W68_000639 [Luteimonas terrae]|uniref:Uncharacterized protein n=1 Tax=Luteimonas terrae TaxID=1530191 RepID=A0ABU1XUW0_9GAMM|nr:hypothetical protein [Luteimonas terrae]